MKLIKIAAMMICALMLFSCAPASPGVDHDADDGRHGQAGELQGDRAGRKGNCAGGGEDLIK